MITQRQHLNSSLIVALLFNFFPPHFRKWKMGKRLINNLVFKYPTHVNSINAIITQLQTNSVDYSLPTVYFVTPHIFLHLATQLNFSWTHHW